MTLLLDFLMLTHLCHLQLLSKDCLVDGLTHRGSTGRVLTSDQLSTPSNSYIWSPLLVGLDVNSSILPKLGLQHEGHHTAQLHSVLLSVRESGNLLPLDQIAPIAQLGVHQRRRSVAHGAHHLSALRKLADNLVASLIGSKIEHGSVSANEENGVKLAGLAHKVAELGRVLPQLALGVEEVDAGLVLFGGLDGGGVERGLAAGWRSDSDLGVGSEDVVGVGEFRLEGG
jgi:hypothetical protein